MASLNFPKHSSEGILKIAESGKDVDEALRSEIQRAERMLENSSEQDEEEGPIFSIETLNRADFFLHAQSNQFRKMYGDFPPAPQVGPGPNASVDLHWKQKDWELLVNVPADADRPATFYGDNYGIQKIKGTLNTKSFNNGIILWLMSS